MMLDAVCYVEQYLAAVERHEGSYKGRDLHCAVDAALRSYYACQWGRCGGFHCSRGVVGVSGAACVGGLGALGDSPEVLGGAGGECCAAAVGGTEVESADSGGDAARGGRGSGEFSADAGWHGGSAERFVSVQEVPAVVQECVLPGKNAKRNARKREVARQAKARLYASGCPSLTSVRTVDTRTAEEIEASRTYALRRAAENKVAEAQAKFKLASYSDPDRVKAHKRLEAMRYSQRINEANAKSQASYKKCDESLKSLGSTGSAGELVLKQQVRQAQEDARMLKYVQAQADYMAKHASPEVQQYVARMPPPKFESAHELFGDCPDDFDDDERADYYRQLDEVDAASAERFAQWF